MFAIALRTVFTYLLLLAFMRLMGKRQIGQLQVSELITTLLISELAASSILDTGIPFLRAWLPLGILLLLEILLSLLTAHFPKLKKIVEGVPSLLIRKGKLDQSELAKMRLSCDELLAELRLQGVGDLTDVDYAILEQSGRLSVILKEEKQPLSPADLHLTPGRRGIDHPLVLMGQYSEFNLHLLGKDHAFVDSRLRKKGCRLSDVLLFTVNDLGEETLIRQEESQSHRKKEDRHA